MNRRCIYYVDFSFYYWIKKNKKKMNWKTLHALIDVRHLKSISLSRAAEGYFHSTIHLRIDAFFVCISVKNDISNFPFFYFRFFFCQRTLQSNLIFQIISLNENVYVDCEICVFEIEIIVLIVAIAFTQKCDKMWQSKITNNSRI